ncbi:DASH complex subunit dam1 [Agyrium rufum]|nr:DASH complex subunit dam1 [Agyrium rufum]
MDPLQSNSNNNSNSTSTARPRNSSLSRPTTPLRSTSRTSLRSSNHGATPGGGTGINGDNTFPLDALEPQFAEFADSMADLEANFMHLQLMHESLSRFSESFASFLYGLNMNAFCVDFGEGPVAESFRRNRASTDDTPSTTQNTPSTPASAAAYEGETTFMQDIQSSYSPVLLIAMATSDTSFAENTRGPSSRQSSKFTTPTPRPPSGIGKGTRGGIRGGPSRGGSSVSSTGGRVRGSGLARAKPRGAR